MDRITDGDPDVQQSKAGNNAAHGSVCSEPCKLRNHAEETIFIPKVGPRQGHDKQAQIQPDDDAQKQIDTSQPNGSVVFFVDCLWCRIRSAFGRAVW